MSFVDHLDTRLPGERETQTFSIQTRRVSYLSQADFQQGTVFLDLPRTRYVLTEDVVFDPDIQAPSSFVLGFFAAIAITASHVELDLGGHTLSQSERHRTQQRFFSLIELGSSPFEQGQGPADFGELKSASHCKVHNGMLGRSSHHSIHGNSNVEVLIENVRCFDFEVASIHLNNPQKAKIRNVQIGPSSTSVPVRGRFSAGTFILPVLKRIPRDKTLDRRDGAPITVGQAIASLETALQTPMHSMFVNDTKLNDGTVYGIVINKRGVAVHGFATSLGSDPADDVMIENVCLEELLASPKEITALKCGEACEGVGYKSGKVQADPFGSVFDIDLCKGDDRQYRPNPLADAQLLVYKHLDKGNISPELVAWAEGKKGFGFVETVQGMDSMAHVIKGNIGIFLSGLTDFNVQHSLINTVHNQGFGNSAGIVLASCQRGQLQDIQIQRIKSDSGNACGVQCIGDCKHLAFEKVQVSGTRGVAFRNVQHATLRECVGMQQRDVQD